MDTTLFLDIFNELKQGAQRNDHPFHFFTLGTVGLDRAARLRTIVLRDFSEKLVLTFYTDRRSKKITHIKENKKVCLLFYHPEKRFQLKIDGIAKVHTDEEKQKPIWDTMHPNAKLDYLTDLAPGTSIPDPNAVEYLSHGDNFCTVEVTPFKIEYLKLQSPRHLRVRFSHENGVWGGDYLVP